MDYYIGQNLNVYRVTSQISAKDCHLHLGKTSRRSKGHYWRQQEKETCIEGFSGYCN
jgi:hypothetical protein